MFLGFFLLVLNFYTVNWARSWLPYTGARWKNPAAAPLGSWKKFCARRAVAGNEIALQ